MNVWSISIRNFRHKPLYTFLSILILSVSIALLLAIQQMEASFKQQLESNLGNIDMVVGAKGSPLQLVLSSVLHIDNPTGNISYKEAQKLSKNPLVKMAVPISYGDNYKGYRIVGTTNNFSILYSATIELGRAVQKPMEVVLGAAVAERFDLHIGDTFLSSHGLAEKNDHDHEEPLTVVGIYKPTHKILDRLIVTDLNTIWDVHHHEAAPHDTHEKEITSLLVTFRSPMGFLTLPRNINSNTTMQAALPKYELERLYQFTGVGVKTVTWIAYIILIISCITIFISLYRMVRDRAFDLALMRTYGANVPQLVKMVAYEGLLIVGIAFIVGILLSQIGLRFIFEMIMDQYKQRVPLLLNYKEIAQTGALALLMVLLAIGLAISPIIKMNISKILSHEK
ncbi:FtsX-like permease family protein [Flagellimonas olearia]|uniref:FtsX-like permease family protein n=1 Tax=Flagellimonas olearia TaxID=552546 RepID=A0A6I1DVK6_9FLAO|nr:ABC transporter permease [Allomuricauda olearia]KAB7529020.1 FtsX-like permease family protein [Allomuricauda olearia]